MYIQKQYLHRGILNPYTYAKIADLRCYIPSESLAPFVDVYFVARWRNLPASGYVVTDVLTRPVVNMFFTKDGATIQGVTNTTRTFVLQGSGLYAGVKFKPGAFYAFCQTSQSTLTNQRQPASRIFPIATSSYSQRLMRYTDDQQIVAELETVLQTATAQPDPKIEQVSNIISMIEQHPDYTVAMLADHFQISERLLQRLFQQYVGVGLKWSLMRNRLLQTLEQALTGDRPSWTTIAAELNYSNQSHFTNEFRRLIGMSPTQYVKQLS